jgi:drug/metabolite transporter (DMT)-like permease
LRLSLGFRYIAASAFCFSVMSLLVKLAGQRLPVQQIVLIRSAISLVLSLAVLRAAGVHLWGSRRRLLLVRGVFGFLALSCFYYGVVHLPLADATVIQYTNPAFTALFAVWVLREPVGLREAAAVVAALAGVVLIARPAFLFGGGGLDPFAAGVALAGAILSGGSYVTVRKLAATEHALVIVFYYALVSTLGSLPGAAAVAIMPTTIEWGLLIGVGISTQLGQIWLTRGLREERAGRAMTVGYLQVLFAAVWGVLFFADVPGWYSLAGALLIVGGTLLVARGAPDGPAGLRLSAAPGTLLP